MLQNEFDKKRNDCSVRSFYGKLPPESIKDLDGLLLEMKSKNKKLLKKAQIKPVEIKQLGQEENLRLWEYLRHCANLVSTWPNVRKAIGIFSEKSGRLYDNLREEFIDSVSVFLYTYAWRKYEHSEDCGYIFSTAEYGYKAWVWSQNMYHSGEKCAAELFEADHTTGGRKVQSPVTAYAPA